MISSLLVLVLAHLNPDLNQHHRPKSNLSEPASLSLVVFLFLPLERSVLPPALLSAASSLRDRAAFFQSETMRPANDPKERDPAHVRMLNDVLRDLEKGFINPQSAPGVYR